MTTQAFNALLKTLEEPPEHVKFIFATTEVQKIPITILSRCQRFDFSGIGTSRIVDRLREVVQAEKMEAEDEALELVARRAGGSMRDAQSLLDQLLAFGGDRLTADQVHQMLGTAHIDRVIEIASAVLENDATQALELLGRAADQGLQLGEFVDQLMDYWRDLMVAHCAGKDFKHLNIPSRHKEALAKQAAKLKLDTILAGLDILSSAKTRLRGIGQARVLLEMTVVRLSRLDDLVSITQLAQLVSQSAGNQSVSGREAGQQQTLGAALANSRAAGQNIGTASSGAADSLKKKLTDSDGGAVTSNFIRVSEESLPSLWQETLKQVGPMLAGALEKSGLPAIFAPNTLVIRFPPDYNSGREHCQNPASVTRIEDVLRKLTGHPVSVRFEVGKSDSATPVTSAPAEEGQDSQSRYRRVRAEAMKEPFIKRAMEVLGAQLVDVEEGFGGSTAATAERNETTDSEES